MEMETLKILAEAGVVGICLTLIAALVYLIRAFMRIVGNHINHNSEVMESLKTLIELKLK